MEPITQENVVTSDTELSVEISKNAPDAELRNLLREDWKSYQHKRNASEKEDLSL